MKQIIVFFGLLNLIRLSLLTSLTFFYSKYITNSNIRKPKIGKYNSKGNPTYYKYKPLVSVIIAAYNEEKVIERTLTELFKSTYKKIEVIVVNDDSSDKTEEIVLAFKKNNPENNLTYILQERGGKAHALNNALQNHVTGKLTMCLDADSVLKEDAIEKAVRYFRNRYVKALAANVKILPGKNIPTIIQRLEYMMGYHLKKSLTVGNMEYIIGGVGSTFRTSTLKKVGGYDTDTITEDIDLTMKILGLGNKKNLIVYAEDVVAYTEGTITLKALFRQRYRWKYGRFQTFWKNKHLFFNKDSRYTKALTHIYLPFQLFSEFYFLLEPIFLAYIIYWMLNTGSISTLYEILTFVMFFTVFAISTDNDSSVKEKTFLLLLSPFSYVMFFIVSTVEYAGLVKCVINCRDIIKPKIETGCTWTPVARLG